MQRESNGGWELEEAIASASALARARLGLAADRAQLRGALERSSDCLGAPLHELVASLTRGSTAAWETFTAYLTIPETYFFRNPRVWQAVTEEIAPELDLAATREGRVPRAWCAGCATGEEAYTLALAYQRARPAGRIDVVGVDVVATRLECARRAVYPAASLRGLSAEQISGWFEPHAEGQRLRPRHGASVRFQELNLGDASAVRDFAAENGPFDLIVCRNVLIYMDETHASELLAQFARALSAGGYVLTGAGDLGGLSPAPLELTRVGTSFALRPPRAQPRPEPQEVSTVQPAGAAGPAPVPVRVPRGGPPEPRRARPAAQRKPAPGAAPSSDLDPETWFEHGLAASHNGALDEAAEAFAGAAFLDADFALAHLHLALTLAARGDRREARAAAQRAAGALEKSDTRSARLAPGGREALAREVAEALGWLAEPM